MSDEQRWLNIDGYPGYRVSDSGTVWSDRSSKEKRSFPDKKGYMRVQVYSATTSKPYTFKVHRLVAQHYIPNPNDLPQINHLDGNKTNNHVSNLEWCTNEQNQAHALANGLATGRFIERQDIAPLLPKIAGALIDGYTIRQIAIRLNAGDGTIFRHAMRHVPKPDFNHSELTRGLHLRKGYYYDKDRGKFRVDSKGIPSRQFTTEDEAKEYIIRQRRSTFNDFMKGTNQFQEQ